MQTKKSSIILLVVGFILIMIVVSAAAFGFYNLNEAASQKATYHRLYGAPVVGGNYTFTPPISKYQAINSALASDNWNRSNLENMTVNATLSRIASYTNITAFYELAKRENITLKWYPDPALNITVVGFGFEYLGEVTVPASNYSVQVCDGVTLRYIWDVSVQKTGGVAFPQYGYFVDASTGERIIVPV